MSAPDLSTEEGRAAYRAELRRVAWPLRLGGLLAIVLGAVWLTLSDGALQGPVLVLAYGLLAVGWGLILTSILLRTRHHRRRMAQEAQADGESR